MSEPIATGDVIQTQLVSSDWSECETATWLVVRNPKNFDQLTCVRIECFCGELNCEDWAQTWTFIDDESDAQIVSRLTQTNGEWAWEVIHGEE